MTRETIIVISKGNRASLDPNRGMTEPGWVKFTLIGISLLFLGLFLVIPLAEVFVSALQKGIGFYFDAIRDPAALSALRLTLLTAFFSVFSI